MTIKRPILCPLFGCGRRCTFLKRHCRFVHKMPVNIYRCYFELIKFWKTEMCYYRKGNVAMFTDANDGTLLLKTRFLDRRGRGIATSPPLERPHRLQRTTATSPILFDSMEEVDNNKNISRRSSSTTTSSVLFDDIQDVNNDKKQCLRSYSTTKSPVLFDDVQDVNNKKQCLRSYSTTTSPVLFDDVQDVNNKKQCLRSYSTTTSPVLFDDIQDVNNKKQCLPSTSTTTSTANTSSITPRKINYPKNSVKKRLQESNLYNHVPESIPEVFTFRGTLHIAGSEVLTAKSKQLYNTMRKCLSFLLQYTGDEAENIDYTQLFQIELIEELIETLIRCRLKRDSLTVWLNSIKRFVSFLNTKDILADMDTKRVENVCSLYGQRGYVKHRKKYIQKHRHAVDISDISHSNSLLP